MYFSPAFREAVLKRAVGRELARERDAGRARAVLPYKARQK
jgi:hypothetical protein